MSTTTAAPRCERSASIPIPILWIDDEVAPDDAALVVLALEGFHVDVATTGAEGLSRAAAGRYAAVLLDLRLPDIPGLTVLGRLQSQGPRAPVVVLTGYGAVASAVQAMKLGAVDYKDKTCGAEDVAATLRAVLGSHPTGSIGVEPDADEMERRVVCALVLRVEDCLSSAGVARELLATIGHPALSLRLFLACAEAHRAVFAAQYPSLHDLIAVVRRILIEALEYRRRLCHEKVVAALRRLEGWRARHLEQDLAADVALDRGYLGHLILQETGIGFCEWRRAAVTRTGLGPILATNDPFKQIAYQLGYEDPAHFTHDVKAVFALTPRELRELGRE